MKIKSLIVLASFFSLGFLVSCDQDDEIEVEYMATYPVSGDWTVNYYVENADGELEEIASGLQILAYNTAANSPTEIWIDDHGTFWDYKVKTPLNIADLSFSGSELQNVSYASKVTITEGKVFRNGTRVNGLQADSIAFKVSFDDDETPYATTFIAAGHRSTGH
jgi:hypothetical protein